MKLTLELGMLIICVVLLMVLVASQYTKKTCEIPNIEGYISQSNMDWVNWDKISQSNISPSSTDNINSLQDLKVWAGSDIRTDLNNYCKYKDNELREGQFCVANCAKVLNIDGWKPGGKLIKTQKGYEWEEVKDSKQYQKVPDTKQRYCQNIILS